MKKILLALVFCLSALPTFAQSHTAGMLDLPNTWTAPQTFSAGLSGTVTAQSVNGILNAALFPGSDIGAKINAAYASILANSAVSGGEIQVPAGNYSYSTPILLRGSKPVFLRCAKGVMPITPGGTTTLTYTPTTGTAFTFDPGTPAGQGGGMDGCSFAGPGKATSTIGFFVGGSSSNVTFQNKFSDFLVSGFGTGLTFGGYTWLDTFDGFTFLNNGTNLYMPAGLTLFGENIKFTNGYFAQWVGFNTSDVNLLADSELIITFDKVSFDNSGVTINGGGAYGVNVSFYSCWWENPVGATTADFLTIEQAFEVDLYGGGMLEDFASSGRTEFILISGGSPNVNIWGGNYKSAETVAQLVNSTSSTATLHMYSPQNSFTNMSGGVYSGKFLVSPQGSIESSNSTINSALFKGLGPYGFLLTPNTNTSQVEVCGTNVANSVCYWWITNVGAPTFNGSYSNANGIILPSSLTGDHGTGGRIQLSDGTGTSGNVAKFAADGSIVDGGVAASAIPTVGTPTVNQAACIKSAGPPVVIGYCSTVVSSAGACTCN